MLWLRPSPTTFGDSLAIAPARDGGALGEFDKAATEPAAAVPGSTGVIAPDIVVSASQEVVVTDVAGAARSLTAAVTAAGGHVSDERTTSGTPCEPGIPVADYGCSSAASSTLTYRVPADRVTGVMDGAAQAGQESWRYRTASDVSTQVADIDARVASAQASLDRLNALMMRAEDLADVVALESQISARQAELESLQAQQRVLADQTALATVTTSFTTAAGVESTGPWAAFQDGLEALGTALLGGLTVLAWLLPFAAFLAVVALPVAWTVRRRRSATRGPSAPEPVEVRDEAREPSRLSE